VPFVPPPPKLSSTVPSRLTHSHRGYGLLFSSDLELPDLFPAAPETQPVDVRIRQVAGLPSQIEDPTNQGVVYQQNASSYLLDLLDIAGARFMVREGREILVQLEPDVDLGAVRLFLLGPCLGALLHQRGTLAIHASAVLTSRGAVLICGPSGSGKSTLAAALRQRGFQVLADEVSVIDPDGDPLLVHPGSTSLRVWRAGLEDLGLEKADLQPVRNGLERYSLPVPRDSADPVPLVGVYYVRRGVVTDEARLTPLRGMKRLMPLLGNVFRPELAASGPARTALCRRILDGVTGRVEVSRLDTPYAASGWLSELADLVEANEHRERGSG
jgi:hypothetical protein